MTYDNIEEGLPEAVKPLYKKLRNACVGENLFAINLALSALRNYLDSNAVIPPISKYECSAEDHDQIPAK